LIARLSDSRGRYLAIELQGYASDDIVDEPWSTDTFAARVTANNGPSEWSSTGPWFDRDELEALLLEIRRFARWGVRFGWSSPAEDFVMRGRAASKGFNVVVQLDDFDHSAPRLILPLRSVGGEDLDRFVNQLEAQLQRFPLRRRPSW
jgi:hypothetical protein